MYCDLKPQFQAVPRDGKSGKLEFLTLLKSMFLREVISVLANVFTFSCSHTKRHHLALLFIKTCAVAKPALIGFNGSNQQTTCLRHWTRGMEMNVYTSSHLTHANMALS